MGAIQSLFEESTAQSAFVFIKPHANTPQVRALCMSKFAEAGISVLGDGEITGPEIDSQGFIDQHYYAIASKATILKPKDLNVPLDKFKENFSEDWPTVLAEERVFNAIDVQAKLGISPDELRALISENLGGFPGVRVNVGQPIAMSVDELLTGTKAQLAVKIFGPDTEVLLEGSQDLQAILQEVPGATDVQADQITGAPQLVVSLDRPALGRYGLSVEEALDALRSGVGGAEAGAVFEGVRQFPVIVRYAEEDRDTPAAIGRIILESSSGARVPLESVADIREIVGPRQITRENGERFITVQLNVRGRDIGSYVADAQAAVAGQLDLPAGYRVEWGGQFELQQEANARFAVVIPITLGIVFLILLLTFGRMKSAILILLNIPLALTGGAMALWVASLPISVPATVGFIALFGIALGNGMVLVSFMDDFAREGRGRDELAVEAAGLRARPVLMTALTTALGLAPLLFASGVGAEVQRPLATVVMGGLVDRVDLACPASPSPLVRTEARRAPFLVGGRACSSIVNFALRSCRFLSQPWRAAGISATRWCPFQVSRRPRCRKNAA